MFQKQLKLRSPIATSEQVPLTKWGTIMEINYQTDYDTRITSEKLLMASHQNIHLFAELTCWSHESVHKSSAGYLSPLVESDNRRLILF